MGEIDEAFEDVIEELKGTADDLIYRRIQHKSFAKVVFWLCVRGRKEEFIMSGDLAEFLGVSTARSYYILQDLCRVGLLKKDCKSSSMAWYWFCIDDLSGKPKINKYFEV